MTVTLTVVCCFQIATGFWSADTRRVQQRLVEEFAKDDKDNPARISPLFKNLDQLKIAPTPPELDFDQPDAPVQPLAPTDLRTQLLLLCEQANVNLSLRSLFAIMIANRLRRLRFTLACSQSSKSCVRKSVGASGCTGASG